MDVKMIQERINKADQTILNDLAAIPDSDYSSLKTIVQSTNQTSREILLRFCMHYASPWSKEILFQLIRDKNSSIRAMAAEEVRGRSRKGDAKRLFLDLEFQYSQKDNESSVANELVLAIGNTKEIEAVEPLMILRKKEKDPETLEAYDRALAKLGFQKETRKIDFALKHGAPKDKSKALKALQYINDVVWIPKIVPLLLNEMATHHTSMGPENFTLRVCDEALETLAMIDPEKKIPFEVTPPEGTPFSKEQMNTVRKAYGLSK